MPLERVSGRTDGYGPGGHPHPEMRGLLPGLGTGREAVNSRERILAALRREDTDRLPCSIYFNDNMRSHGYDPGSAGNGHRLP